MDLKITTLIAAGAHEEALTLLVSSYRDPVARFCAGLVGSEAEAEELSQDAFVEALGAMGRFHGDAGVKPWIFGIARRVCIRHLRKRDRRSSLLARWWSRSEEGEGAGPDPERAHARREEVDHLSQALGGLKPHLREAVLLRYQAGLDGPEIAAALGIRPAAARKRVSLGLSALRTALRPVLYAAEAPDKAPSGRSGVAGSTPEGEPGARNSELAAPRSDAEAALGGDCKESDHDGADALRARPRPRIVRS